MRKTFKNTAHWGRGNKGPQNTAVGIWLISGPNLAQTRSCLCHYLCRLPPPPASVLGVLGHCFPFSSVVGDISFPGHSDEMCPIINFIVPVWRKALLILKVKVQRPTWHFGDQKDGQCSHFPMAVLCAHVKGSVRMVLPPANEGTELCQQSQPT